MSGDRRWAGFGATWLSVLAVVGWAVGTVFMLIGWDSTPPSLAFVRLPEAQVWILLVGIQVAFWSMVAGALWRDAARLRTTTNLDRAERAVIVAGAALVAAPVLLAPALARPITHADPIPLAGSQAKMLVVYLAAAGVASIGVAGLWLVSVCFARDLHVAGSTHEQLASFIEARQTLLRIGSILAAMVALATLATGALRDALLAARGSTFSATMVLAYGAAYTAVLAVLYVPPYVNMQASSRRLTEALYPPLLPGEDGFADRQQHRSDLAGILRTDVAAPDSLKVAAAVLAPLVSGLVAVLVGVST